MRLPSWSITIAIPFILRFEWVLRFACAHYLRFAVRVRYAVAVIGARSSNSFEKRNFHFNYIFVVWLSSVNSTFCMYLRRMFRFWHPVCSHQRIRIDARGKHMPTGDSHWKIGKPLWTLLAKRTKRKNWIDFSTNRICVSTAQFSFTFQCLVVIEFFLHSHGYISGTINFDGFNIKFIKWQSL